MLKRNKIFCSGQSILEYATLLGIIAMVVYTMSPLLKRSLQGMIKLTADQVGYQNSSDQQISEKSGFMIYTDMGSHVITSTTTEDVAGVTTYYMNDRTDATTQSQTNLGFTEKM